MYPYIIWELEKGKKERRKREGVEGKKEREGRREGKKLRRTS